MARGADPQDHERFAPARVPTLLRATQELSWLLGRGYAEPSALALVGNRHALHKRERDAVMRCACPDQARAHRGVRRVDTIAGAALAIAQRVPCEFRGEAAGTRQVQRLVGQFLIRAMVAAGWVR